MQRRTAVLTIIAALVLGIAAQQATPLWASVFGDVSISNSAAAAERLKETLIKLGDTDPEKIADEELVEMLGYIIHGNNDDRDILCPDAPECISSDPYCFYGAPEKDADGCIVGCGPMACQGSAAPRGAPTGVATPTSRQIKIHQSNACSGYSFLCDVPDGCFLNFERGPNNQCIAGCGTPECPDWYQDMWNNDDDDEVCLTIPDDCPRGGDCAYPETRYSQTDPMCAIDCGEPTHCVDDGTFDDACPHAIAWERECIPEPGCSYQKPERDQSGCIVGCGEPYCDEEEYTCLAPNDCPALRNGCSYTQKEYAPDNPNCLTSCGEPECDDGGTLECPPEPECIADDGCWFEGERYDANDCRISCGKQICPSDEEEYVCLAPNDCPALRNGCSYTQKEYAPDNPNCLTSCGEPECDDGGTLLCPPEPECIADDGCWFEGERYDANDCRISCGKQICAYTCIDIGWDCPRARDGCGYPNPERSPHDYDCLTACGDPECDDGGTLLCPPEPECIADDGCWFEDELRDANDCLFACGQQVCPDTEEEDDWWDDLLNWDDWFEQTDDEEHDEDAPDEGDDAWTEEE